jgi:DNA modification methylase
VTTSTIDSLPGPEALDSDGRRFHFDAKFARLTHYLFRYPAKFHPPVARQLLQNYSAPGDLVLDPFCGSGSLLVEASVLGRACIGTDIDPLAVFVSKVKKTRLRGDAVKGSAARLCKAIERIERSNAEYIRRRFKDISIPAVRRITRTEGLPVPELPRIFHWFRRYVVVDLGRLLATICRARMPETHRNLFLLCFASTIRGASNADPVPVSGLEVTAHMKRLDARGRVVNPFGLFRRAVDKALVAVAELGKSADRSVAIRAIQADVTRLSRRIKGRVDVVITSPPYNSAVDYYRRHLLEMFWLGLTKTEGARLRLLPRYVGRDKVPRSHERVKGPGVGTPLVRKWEAQIEERSPERARAFRHYTVSMQLAFGEIARVLKPDGLALFVVGHSKWKGREIPTASLFVELAGDAFELVDQLSYPVKNRYMSYSRHNGASIDKEYVLVFRRMKSPLLLLRSDQRSLP